MNYIRTIVKLIDLSPVPVNFPDTIDSGFIGAYYHNGISEGHPYIEIENSLVEGQKIATLVHEIKHAKCDKRGCKCMKNSNRAEREIHAYTCELKWLLRYKQKERLKGLIERFLSYTEHNDDHYSEAIKHITKSKLWKRCLKFIGD